jgi:hypothetical protein
LTISTTLLGLVDPDDAIGPRIFRRRELGCGQTKDFQGADLVLTLCPPKEMKEERDGIATHNLFQGQVCSTKTTSFICSVCKDENEDGTMHGKEAWICMNKRGRTGFPEHMTNKH